MGYIEIQELLAQRDSLRDQLTLLETQDAVNRANNLLLRNETSRLKDQLARVVGIAQDLLAIATGAR